MTANIIEPPPEAKLNPRAIHAPPPSVIEPPPSANVARNIGNLNVGHLAATVAAPKIEVAEQKVITIQPGGADVSRSLGRNSRGTPPPAPAIMPVGGANAGPNTGQLIALNVHPAIPTGPISVPPGRRSGEFAVGPEGMPNAPATPDIKAGGSGAGGASEGNNRLPTGITIGNAPEAPPRGSVIVEGDPKTQPRDASRDKEMLMAAARPPRIGEIPRHTTTTPPPSGPKVAEDRVFGAKQIYTLALNTPNLSSTGGSWIIRFAQLEEDHIPLPLSAPVATRTVDPAYPAELMREGYEGTVILYAVIHKDGTVGEVRVLRGVEGRLDENARVALLRWKFRPGTKNGQAVDLEAVVQIPFKATRIPY
jgi:TonB family protein